MGMHVYVTPFKFSYGIVFIMESKHRFSRQYYSNQKYVVSFSHRSNHNLSKNCVFHLQHQSRCLINWTGGVGISEGVETLEQFHKRGLEYAEGRKKILKSKIKLL